MICGRCKRNNPKNVNHCIYCGAPLRQNIVHRNINRNNANRSHNNNKIDSADKMIIALIIALIVVLVSIAGVYAYKQNHRKSTFRSGGGGMIVSNQQLPSDNDDMPVTLDGDDPDVEIYSFNTDTYDILVGNTKEVKFTAEIFANVELSDTDVSVTDTDGVRVGYMNDSGINGDIAAGDGIYTLVAEMYSETRKTIEYQARVKSVVSHSVELCFYTDITAEDLNICQNIINRVHGLNDLSAIKQFLAHEVSIEYFLVSPDNQFVQYKMKSGILCVWEAAGQESDNQFKSCGQSVNDIERFASELDYGPISDQISQMNITRAGANGDVCVIRPFRGTQFTYDDFSDAGGLLANALDGQMSVFDDENAGMDKFKTFGDYGVLMIDSHGTLSSRNNASWEIINTDPYMLTGETFESSQAITSADFQSERVVICSANNILNGSVNGGIVAVGAKFFDRYYTDHSLDGLTAFLGTCYSMYNDTIADVLIKKGAEVVYGYSNSVSVDYCNKTMREMMLNQLIVNQSTARQAFTNTQQICGASDPLSSPNKICKLCMKGNDSFKLVSERKKGIIAGSVKDASSGSAINRALVRIYKDSHLTESIRTDENGYYSVKVPADNDYVVKISYAHYKTAKASANVSEDITTYIETFLMLNNGINSGFANGTITNAITGEEVDDVLIKMRASWNNKSGAVVHTTSTNENGYYEISYSPGFYTIEYSKDGFITGYKNIIIGIIDFVAQNAAISPELPDDGTFRIVLSWSSIPKDLDSHLTGPTVEGNRFHLYYKYANTSNRNENMDYYQLDLDNTDIISKPNIPETTTIVTQLDGVYRYSVHDYTNRGNSSSEAMSQSNATVNVYKGSVLVATYHVPPNVKGSIWTVFELSGNEIVPINKIGNGYEDDMDLF